MTDAERHSVCFTGHRHIPAEELPGLTASLDAVLRRLYQMGCRTFLCGGALGFDLLAAERTLWLRAKRPDVRLWMTLPCADQTQRWPDREKNRHLYLTGAADERTVLSPHYYNGCMMVRNRFMVNHSAFCVCYLREMSGGTMSTVAYASRQGLTIVNLAMADSVKRFVNRR